MMKLSIITVCYNSEKCIEKTIESVMHQSFKPYEYIFVDGNSCDGTLEIIKSNSIKLEAMGISVQIVSENDKGIYDAMNKGVLLARGEWLCFLNTGDVFVENRVLENVFLHNNIYRCDVMYGDSVTPNGKLFSTKGPWMLPYKKPFYHQAAFIRTEIQRQYLFNLEYKICADYDSFLRMYVNNCTFKRIKYIIAKADEEGISKNPRNRVNIIQEDLEIIKRNGINMWKYPLLAYYNFLRKKELRKCNNG